MKGRVVQTTGSHDDPPHPTVLPIIATVAWCVLFVAVAIWRFRREEFCMTGERVVPDVVIVACWGTPFRIVSGILAARLLFGVRNKAGVRQLRTEGGLG